MNSLILNDFYDRNILKKSTNNNTLITDDVVSMFSYVKSSSTNIISKTVSQINTRFSDIFYPNPLDTLRQPPKYTGFQTANDVSGLNEIAKQYLRESKWGGPCDAMFKYLTKNEPMVLLNLIRSDSLEPGFLSTAAEFAGRINDPEQVIPLLLKLTHHAYPMVREGAVYGLANFISVGNIRQYLQEMSETDSSPGVRSSAQEMLED
jgi:hypothetical protein